MVINPTVQITPKSILKNKSKIYTGRKLKQFKEAQKGI